MNNPFGRFDREKLREQFTTAKPVPHIVIDDFIPADDARAVVAAYPDFGSALELGKTFKTVNERKKVQVSDYRKFTGAVSTLNTALASSEFLADLSYITNMPNLLADEQLLGGGIHITGPGAGWTFMLTSTSSRIDSFTGDWTLLLYLNEPWQKAWGGQFQLWDADVEHCEATFDPIFNRCVIFETNEVSYHGVIPVSPSAPAPRRSFATYYYTKEAPAHWTGASHSTIFRARPEERMKGLVLMPAEIVKNNIAAGVRRVKRGIRKLLKS